MPTPADLKEKFKQLREAVESQMPDIAAKVATSAKALSERNIREFGFGPHYSSVKYPAWFLHGKALNAAGRTFLSQRGVNEAGVQGAPKKKRRKKGETADPGTYDKLTNWGEFREAQGLQADHVDLGYTNFMWGNMQVVKLEKAGTIQRAYLGGTNEETQDKMNWNADRYGDFIMKGLSDQNKVTLQEVVVEEVQKIIKSLNL